MYIIMYIIRSLYMLTMFLCSLQLRSMFLPDRYIDHGAPQDQIEEAGLTPRHIAATALSLLGRPLEAMQLK